MQLTTDLMRDQIRRWLRTIVQIIRITFRDAERKGRSVFGQERPRLRTRRRSVRRP